MQRESGCGGGGWQRAAGITPRSSLCSRVLRVERCFRVLTGSSLFRPTKESNTTTHEVKGSRLKVWDWCLRGFRIRDQGWRL